MNLFKDANRSQQNQYKRTTNMHTECVKRCLFFFFFFFVVIFRDLIFSTWRTFVEVLPRFTSVRVWWNPILYLRRCILNILHYSILNRDVQFWLNDQRIINHVSPGLLCFLTERSATVTYFWRFAFFDFLMKN